LLRMKDAAARRSYARGGSVLLMALLLSFVSLYGANWLIFHPDITPGFLHDPLLGIPQSADVIVVLAGNGERILYAASLIERGLAPRLLTTLVDPACLRAGHPLGTCATGVRNTADEALVMRRVLEREQMERIMIVTSRSHLVRATAVFRVVFLGSGMELNVVPTPHDSFHESPAIRELLSFFPSLGCAVLGRLNPELYGWIMQYRRPVLLRDATTSAHDT
jgi:uncharacterized SAM-binding protein YcdF (DUF218 family)